MPKRILYAVRRSVTAPAVRYPPDPRALFLLAMCVISGVPLVFADAAPRSVVANLDDPWVIAWGVMLVGGAGLTLWGALRQTVNGVIAEQVGSVGLGFACLIFSLAVFGYNGWAGSVAALLILGFGLASLWRWGQLVAYVKSIEKATREMREEATGEQ
jgi:hypothetical protein